MDDVRDSLAAFLRGSDYKRKAVAEKAGLGYQQLSDIIGKRRRLEANELYRLCVALDVTPNELFGVSPRAAP